MIKHISIKEGLSNQTEGFIFVDDVIFVSPAKVKEGCFYKDELGRVVGNPNFPRKPCEYKYKFDFEVKEYKSLKPIDYAGTEDDSRVVISKEARERHKRALDFNDRDNLKFNKRMGWR